MLTQIWNAVKRLLFLQKPERLYHYSTADIAEFSKGQFIFRVVTAGKMYSLDIDSGFSMIKPKGGAKTLIVFTGKASTYFKVHSPFFIYGFKFFFRHFKTDKIGDVRFLSTKLHPGNLVEVSDFEIIQGTKKVSRLRLRRIRGLEILAFLLCFSLPMGLVVHAFSGGSIPADQIFEDLLPFSLIAFFVAFGFSFCAWFFVERKIFSQFENALNMSGLSGKLSKKLRVLSVIWACIAVGLLWVVYLYSFFIFFWFAEIIGLVNPILGRAN